MLGHNKSIIHPLVNLYLDSSTCKMAHMSFGHAHHHNVSELLKAVALRQSEEAAALLEDKNVKKHINDVDVHGNSALNYACAMGLPDSLILRMLDLGADPKSKNHVGSG
jgi:ankyrin repeat protein